MRAEGDVVLNKRYELIKKQKQNILNPINEFNYYLKKLEYKDGIIKLLLVEE